MNKILLVEDHQDISELVISQLNSQGYQIQSCTNGEQAQKMIEKEPQFELFIIDWMIPRLSGIELCKWIRTSQHHRLTPILMLTALTSSENIIKGLDAGADDYITKPFDMNVLLARVRAQLRKNKKSDESLYLFGSLSIDSQRCEVRFEQELINLTNTEYQILFYLAQKPGHVFTREQLINSIQGQNIFVTNRTIDTHIAGLRKKIKDASKYIETIRGIGYKLNENS